MKPESVSSGLAIAHLYRRFPPPEFFAVHEMVVGDTVAHEEPGFDGYRRTTERRADFLALRLWGASHSSLRGFEVKVSRSDFLAELRNPEKRAPLEAACSACYFVAPRNVLDPSELPEGWGWLELSAAGLRMRKEAPHRKREIPMWVYHALFKRMHDMRWYDRARRPALLDWPKEVFSFGGMAITPGKLEALAMEAFAGKLRDIQARARQEGRDDALKERAAARDDADRWRRLLGRALGVDGSSLVWMNEGDLAARIAAVRAGGSASVHKTLLALQAGMRDAARLARDLRTAHAKLTSIPDPPA